MKRLLPLLLLLAVPAMAQEKEFPTDFTEDTSPSGDSMLLLVRPPFATGDERKVTVTNLLAGRLTAADIDDPVDFGSLLWDPATQVELDGHGSTTGAHLPAGISWGATVDCPGANGGALTIAGNQIICSDDDGGGGGGLLGSGTVDSYPIWTATDTLGDGRFANNGNDVDLGLPAGGKLELDGAFQLFTTGSNPDAALNATSGKLIFQVLGVPGLEVHFASVQAVQKVIAQNGLEVSGGSFYLPRDSTLPTCNDNRLVHIDADGPAMCWCNGSSWVLMFGTGPCN